MDRFLIVQHTLQSAASEVNQKIPRPPNGFKWCVRQLDLDVKYLSNASGQFNVQFWNDKAGDMPVASNVSTRKFIGALNVTYDATNYVVGGNFHKLFPRGSKILNEVYIDIITSILGSPVFQLVCTIIIELIPCSAIDQLKSDLLASD